MEENEAINSIEEGRKVRKAETSNLLMSNCCDMVFVERKESSFN